MKTSIFNKIAVFLMAVALYSPTMFCLLGAEDDVLRTSAEKFVRQICEQDTDAILQSYPMTDEFKAIVPDADTVVSWATEMDNLFGRLGEVSHSEIIEHQDLGLRSVYLYYQGTKCPAKIWVTFSGTVITGLHYNVWIESYTEGEPTRMSVTESIFWSFILVTMIIMSLFLLNGKGAFLVAGYNTMSKKKQAKYDEKALCRATGRFLLWMTCCVILLPFSIISGVTWMPYCAEGIIAVSVLVFMIYANTGNRFHKKVDVEKFVAEESEEEKALNAKKEAKQEKFQLWLLGFTVFGLFAVIAAIPVLLLLGEKDSTVKIIDTGIKISGMYGLKIDFSEITDISLMENGINDIGLTFRTNGYGTSSTQKGYFQSNMYGSVLLFTKTNSSPTIHIKRNGKEDVFLNLSNNEATRTLYNDMKTAFAR